MVQCSAMEDNLDVEKDDKMKKVLSFLGWFWENIQR